MAKPTKLAKLAEQANYKVATLAVGGATSCGDSFLQFCNKRETFLSTLHLVFEFLRISEIILDTSIAKLADSAKWANIAGRAI